MGCVSGGAKRDRTADLFAASEALSQLSYGPIRARIRPCVRWDVKTHSVVGNNGGLGRVATVGISSWRVGISLNLRGVAAIAVHWHRVIG